LPTLPDASSLPLPSVSDVSDAVSEVFVTAIDTAGDAATAVVDTARRRPKVAIGVAVAAMLLVVVLMLRRRRHAAPAQASRDDRKPHVAAA
jgi:hypothetical protein